MDNLCWRFYESPEKIKEICKKIQNYCQEKNLYKNRLAPKKVIGTDTIGSMQSGLIFGEAARMDGMIAKIRQEAGCEAPVIATGGMSKVVLPHCQTEILYDDHLVLKGLREIYKMNR